VKTNADGSLYMGMGYYTRSNSEVCLLAIKGSPLRFATDVHEIVMAPVGKHSEKPEEVRQRIERLFPGPYLELYARKTAPGWTCWSDEISHGEFREPLATLSDHQRAEDSGTQVAPFPGDDLSIPEFLRRPPPEAAQ
jgi:N6-adenosine-specific RNA methylase IME4